MQNLRVPGALVCFGFVGVLAWTTTYLIAVLPNPYASTTLLYWLATTVGYGLAGFACWRWIARNWTEKEDSPIRGPSRWMAAASLVTAAGVAAIAYQTYQARPAFALDNLDLHYGLRLGGEVAGTLGFVLAAAGFWVASTASPAQTEAGEGESRAGAGRRSDPANDFKAD